MVLQIGFPGNLTLFIFRGLIASVQDILATETVAQPEKFPLANQLCRLAEPESSKVGKQPRAFTRVDHHASPGTLLEYLLMCAGPDNEKPATPRPIQ